MNGFVTDATRNTVSGSQPTVTTETSSPTAVPTASAGTDHSVAAASQMA